MGEEQEKKPEEKKEENKKEEAPKAEDVKKDEKKSDDSPAAAAPEAEKPPPPPPQEIVLKVYMHCEGCARKVSRCLKGFPGVEEVITDCKTSKVVVKGEKADPIKVLERVQKKSHRQVELISPIPKPPSEEPKKEEKQEPKAEEKKEEPPVITVVLSVYMHCEACAQEIKKRILRMKGVESAEPDLKISQVTVKGVIEPEKLTDYVYKRTGKQALIVKVEPEQKKEPEKEEKKPDSGEKEPEKKPEEPAKENKESEGGGKAEGAQAAEPEPEADDSKLELKRNEFYYYYPPNHHQVYDPPRFVQADPQYYAYPPQIFSDENPNACSVM